MHMKMALAAQNSCPSVSNYQSEHSRSTLVKLDTDHSSLNSRIRMLLQPIFYFFVLLQRSASRIAHYASNPCLIFRAQVGAT
jgi:hypothetical protein